MAKNWTNNLANWSHLSLVEGDEGSYQPKRQTLLDIDLQDLFI